MTRILWILAILASICHSECKIPLLSIGNFNLTSEKQLKEIIKKEPVFLISIVSSVDCPKCCESEAVLESLLENLEKYSPKVPLLRVDVTKTPFINKYILAEQAFPQIYGVKKGTFFKYFDLQDPLKILRFTDKLISPVYYMNKYDEVVKFLKLPLGGFNSLKILGVFFDSDLQKEFEKVASKLVNWFASDIRAITDKKLIKELKNFNEIEYLNQIILMRTDDFLILDLEVPQNIQNWIVKNSLPTVGELTAYNFYMYLFFDKPMLLLFTDPSSLYHHEYIGIYTKVAEKFRDYVMFVWLNSTNPEYFQRKIKLGLTTKIIPAIGFNSRNGINFPYPEGKEINEKNLDIFVQDYLDSNKSPYLAKHIPTKINLSECEKLEEHDFGEIVMHEEYDAVIFVYSSFNNKESEKFGELYNNLCRKIRKYSKGQVSLYVFDAAIEKVDRRVKSNKFPSLMIAPAHKKNKFIYFNGAWTFRDLAKFIEKNVEFQLSLPQEFFSNELLDNNTNEL